MARGGKFFGRDPFGRGPRRVPDPGQRVRLRGEDGRLRPGFRAISGPLSDDTYGVVVWVSEEEEWETATIGKRPPVGMAWPLDRIELDEESG